MSITAHGADRPPLKLRTTPVIQMHPVRSITTRGQHRAGELNAALVGLHSMRAQGCCGDRYSCASRIQPRMQPAAARNGQAKGRNPLCTDRTPMQCNTAATDRMRTCCERTAGNQLGTAGGGDGAAIQGVERVPINTLCICHVTAVDRVMVDTVSNDGTALFERRYRCGERGADRQGEQMGGAQ